MNCSKEKDNSSPDIEWVNPDPGDVVSVNIYFNGVASGEYFHQKFKVLNGSGEISFVVQNTALNLTKTSTFNVEQGKQYDLISTINFISQSGIPSSTKCQTFVISSSNCPTNKEVYIYQVTIRVTIPVTYSYTVCPGSYSIGEISLNPVK
jgi:hypothetical protein